MQGGKLRHKVTIEQPVETLGTLGQPEVSWQAFSRPRIAANVMQLTGAGGGREIANAEQMQADQTYSVKLRYYKGITSKMRVVWHDSEGDRFLPIIGPPSNPDGRKREMILACKEAS